MAIMIKRMCSGLTYGCFERTDWLADSHERVVDRKQAVSKGGRVIQEMLQS